jgi:DNA-binding transcriptional MerR regulator/methylmalonyl-CoA mutase cobalamin-binding subunit
MFSIRTLAALTGVNPVTLRAWERRHGLLEPQRTAKGHRLYSERDVERIRRVLALTRDGVPISQVKDALGEDSSARASKEPAGPWPGYQRRFAAAIAAFDETELEAIYNEALSLHPQNEVDRLLLVPMLETLGARWSEVAGGVAEEHFLSAYLRNKVGARFHHRRALESGPKILAACAPGEQHEIGLLLFALAAHDAGFRIVLLGADVPFREIAAAANRAQCEAVVIANSIPRSTPEFYVDLSALVNAVKRPVYVGGNAALPREKEISVTGAVPLTTSIESAIRRIANEIPAKRRR